MAFVPGDLAQVRLEEHFDAVVGRLILLYIPDRAALLRRLSQRLRPGGILAFEELDLTLAGTTLPHAPLFGQAATRLNEVFGRAGLDTQGMNLFRVFVEAGLPAPEMELITTVGGGLNWAGHEQIADVTSALLPLMVQFGIATEEEVQVTTPEQRLREEATQLHSVAMARGLMHARTRLAGNYLIRYVAAGDRLGSATPRKQGNLVGQHMVVVDDVLKLRSLLQARASCPRCGT